MPACRGIKAACAAPLGARLFSIDEGFAIFAFGLGNYCLSRQAAHAVSQFQFTPPMNERETSRYDMFGGVQTFGTDNAADFAAGAGAGKRFANIGKISSDLNDVKAAQV